MTHFEIVHLSPGQQHSFARKGKQEKLIVGEGRCRIGYNGTSVLAERGTNLDLAAAGTPVQNAQFEVSEVLNASILIRMCGDWGEQRGGSGLFSVAKSEQPQDKGDPTDYPKETNFDRHYHDCDEYWILFKGRGVAVSEDQHYAVGPGDCVATGMGHHHDFPIVSEPVEAVFFETTLQGQKRRGHLWNHTHGPAQPQPERI
jgi:mannose-6-phosphate isomerase-like protein (cupin superfamily)